MLGAQCACGAKASRCEGTERLESLLRGTVLKAMVPEALVAPTVFEPVFESRRAFAKVGSDLRPV